MPLLFPARAHILKQGFEVGTLVELDSEVGTLVELDDRGQTASVGSRA